MKKSSGNRKSNLLILAIVGVIIIIFGVFSLIYSQQEATAGGWKSKAEMQEQIDEFGPIGAISLVVGIVIVGFAFVKNLSNSKLSAEESVTIDRYEKRLKELHDELKENKITKEEYTDKKSIILNNIVSEVNTLDLLKKRLREMTIQDLVTDDEVKGIIENIDKEIKKAKKKIKIIICIIIIGLCLARFINGLLNSSWKNDELPKPTDFLKQIENDR